MSAIDVNRQAVERLGAGDTVTPRENLKSLVLAMTRAVDVSHQEDGAESLFGRGAR